MVVITISGPHGAGKSTYAKAIADALNLKYVSSGQTFTASLDTRVKRISERDGTNYKKAKKETIARTNSEIKRFQKMYELNVQQKHIYDLILNTDRLSIDKCTQILIAACRQFD